MTFPSGAIPGLDVSHYQEVVDWPALSAAGETFAFAKASESGSVADVYFADNWMAVKSAGMMRGAYHFFHPATDPIKQADFFLNRLANANGGSTLLAPGDLPATLDLEVTDGVDPAAIITGATAWLIAVEKATQRQPILYTYVDFWNSKLGNPADLSGYPLWIAELNVNSPQVPGAWKTWIFWQFAKQNLNGVSTGVVDVDAFNGTLGDLRQLAGYTSAVEISSADQVEPPGRRKPRKPRPKRHPRKGRS